MKLSLPIDWRDAPERVWLHPHRWPSGVQTPAPLVHVSTTAPGHVCKPGEPASCRDWWAILRIKGDNLVTSKIYLISLSSCVWSTLYICHINYSTCSIFLLLLHISLLHYRWGFCSQQPVSFSRGWGNSSWALLFSQQMFHSQSPMPFGQHVWILSEWF